MRRGVAILGLVLAMLAGPGAAASLCGGKMLAEALPPEVPRQGSWRQLFNRDEICVWSRSAYADDVQEVAAVARVSASPGALAKLIIQCDQVLRAFKDVVSCQELRTRGNSLWMFQQLDFPWPAQDRFFTVKLDRQSAGGTLSEVSWVLADPNVASPRGEGIPVERNTGRWRFRSADGAGGASLAFFYLSIDPGGSVRLPDWLMEFGHQSAVPNMYDDMRQAVR